MESFFIYWGIIYIRGGCHPEFIEGNATPNDSFTTVGFSPESISGGYGDSTFNIIPYPYQALFFYFYWKLKRCRQCYNLNLNCNNNFQAKE